MAVVVGCASARPPPAPRHTAKPDVAQRDPASERAEKLEHARRSIDLDAAIAAYKEALAMAVEAPVVAEYVALLVELERKEDAVAEAKRFWQRAPHDPAIVRVYFDALADTASPQALELVEQLAVDDSPASLVLRGRALVAAGQYAKGVALIEQAIAREPGVAAHRLALAIVTVAKSAWGAARIARKVVALDPSIGRAWLILAVADWDSKETERAYTEASKRLRGPRMWRIRAERDWLDRPADSARYLEHALKIEPSNGELWLLRAQRHLLDQQPDLAEAAFRRALVGPRPAQRGIVELGKLLVVRDPEEARTLAAAATTPADARLLIDGGVLLRAGDTDRAIASLDRFLVEAPEDDPDRPLAASCIHELRSGHGKQCPWLDAKSPATRRRCDAAPAFVARPRHAPARRVVTATARAAARASFAQVIGAPAARSARIRERGTVIRENRRLPIEIERTLDGDRFRIAIAIGGERVTYVGDRRRASQRWEGCDPVVLEAAERDALVEQAWRAPELLATRTWTIEPGVDAHSLVLVAPSGSRSTLRLDPATRMLRALEYFDGDSRVVEELGDWRTVGRTRVPHARRILTNGREAVVLTTESVELDLALAADAFE